MRSLLPFVDSLKSLLRLPAALCQYSALSCLRVVKACCLCLAWALQDIIGRFPDLIDGFQRFLQRCETMDAVDSEMRSQFGAGKISAKDMARLRGQTVK